MKYTTKFCLVAAVNDVKAAREYLTEDDMTQFLKEDSRIEPFADCIVRIEWNLLDEMTGTIDLYTSVELCEEELALVSEWVSGQNSDGLGEGFEQQPFANYEDEDSIEEYWDEDDEEYYETDPEYVMASFDWETNDYIFSVA